jgi:RNA polymerase primary sigma factor
MNGRVTMTSSGRAREEEAGSEPEESRRLLTPEAERELAESARGGDRAARARLIEANLRLVGTIAHGYRGLGLDRDDLIAEGNLGLVWAADHYNPALGSRFGTYAVYWIKRAIRQALTDTSRPIRLPSHVVRLLARWSRVERRLRHVTGQTPDPSEVARELGLTASQLRMVAQAGRTRVKATGSEPGEARSSGNLLDEAAARVPMDSTGLEDEEERAALRCRIAGLPPREARILTLRFGLDGTAPLSLRETGRELGFTPEWTRKLERRALDGLAADDRPASRRGVAGGVLSCPG